MARTATDRCADYFFAAWATRAGLICPAEALHFLQNRSLAPSSLNRIPSFAIALQEGQTNMTFEL